MIKYPKIHGLYKRDSNGRFMIGEYSKLEFGHLEETLWTWTEKIDGQNIRIGMDKEGKILFHGRSDNAELNFNLVDELEQLFYPKMTELLDVFGGYDDWTIFGEGVGAKINKSGDYFGDYGFVAFDIWADGLWFDRDAVDSISGYLGLHYTPTIFKGTIGQAVDFVSAGMQRSQFHEPERTPRLAEGLVGTPSVGLLDRWGSRIITKVKRRDFTNAGT